MNQPRYVVRAWKATQANHARVTVVDMKGGLSHLTVHRSVMANVDAHQLIERRLDVLDRYRAILR